MGCHVLGIIMPWDFRLILKNYSNKVFPYKKSARIFCVYKYTEQRIAVCDNVTVVDYFWNPLLKNKR